MKFSGFEVKERVTFLDYIMGGCRVNMHVAIDFTLSNKEPENPQSLHYINPKTQTNSYTEVINSVVGILQNYDDDKMFPVYGFGGKPPMSPENEVSTALPLTATSSHQKSMASKE